MIANETRGQIITFYSYKGGTGRSMALANIACILAKQQSASGGKGVLMIDWDLEAPGLHRYFGDRLTTTRLGIEGLDRKEAHNSMPGLIDLFYEFDKQLGSSTIDGSATSEQAAREAIGRVKLSDFVISTTINGLSLLKAGRFASPDPNEYSERVNKFNWENLFKKSPHLMRVFAETLAKQYAYVLIDSRTGVTDISGITTTLLPEKLVVVFTPNLQSLKGGLELIRKATEYRKDSVDLRRLTVFPLVSRVEMTEDRLRHEWRVGTTEHDGYEPEFEKTLSEVYGEKIKLKKYFDDLQIQHIPQYAYGEQVAVLVEKTSDKFSLRRSYQTFAAKLVKPQAPWEGEIEEGAGFAQQDSVLKIVLNSVIRFGRSHAAALFIALYAVSLVAVLWVAFSKVGRARVAEQTVQMQLQKEQEQNLQLTKEVEDLKKPIKDILAENDKQIAQLAQQVESVSNQRDEAMQEAQRERDAAAQSKQQADRATQAQKRAEDSLTTVQADRDDTVRVYRDILSKYTVSQKEVRTLQARVANCRAGP